MTDPFGDQFEAVARRPADLGLRLGLVSDLLRADRIADAFAHLSEAWTRSLGDPMDELLVQRALAGLAERYQRAADLASTPSPDSGREPGPDSGPAPGSAAALPSAGESVEEERLDIEFTSPEVTLADVAGLDDVKANLERVVFGPIRNPELAEAFGRTMSGGMLLWGPPGCGKTFIAKALAGSLAVSFASVAMDDVLDLWLGNSEKNLASLFRAARDEAPCVLFFDEIDAVGGRRSRMGVHASMRSVVSQLLVETDGVGRDNAGVFLVGATNLPWDVDPALRRPGRLDRTIFVPPPDASARTSILAAALATVPLDPAVRLDAVAAATAGYSGADVAAVASDATDRAFEASTQLGSPVAVSQAHLEVALAASSPSIADWVQVTMIAAEASADVDLFGPFLRWARANGHA